MYSGKTEEFIRRLKRAQIARLKVQIFKPVIDDRYSKDHVMSHDASKLLSIPVTSSRELLEKVEDNTRVVGIDEVQFFDHGIVDVAQKLANRGIRVICAGLDMDFLGRPFEPVPTLMAVAEYVTKLHAICVVCGAEASRSQKISGGSERISVGSRGMYEARCRFCHDPNESEQAKMEFIKES
jgi:thymidine kinase